jgi:hypothetical protein
MANSCYIRVICVWSTLRTSKSYNDFHMGIIPFRSPDS